MDILREVSLPALNNVEDAIPELLGFIFFSRMETLTVRLCDERASGIPRSHHTGQMANPTMWDKDKEESATHNTVHHKELKEKRVRSSDPLFRTLNNAL
ncbi:hypothetical protein M514_11363 [Trichuris suis]|uniref:Uncharacterized protein n=1 Tax=Trichuris suis TaxID=68888 RepID=A0A085NDF5_9BILA|nr:hypothetical protein M513_11363 [Trichuris suis]KFD67501.1 hypothetical protein M514_11363 [Trichuris suis]